MTQETEYNNMDANVISQSSYYMSTSLRILQLPAHTTSTSPFIAGMGVSSHSETASDQFGRIVYGRAGEQRQRRMVDQ